MEVVYIDTTSKLLWCWSGHAIVNAADRVLAVKAGDLIIAPHGALITKSAEAHLLAFEYAEFSCSGPTRAIQLGSDWQWRMIAEYSRCQLGQAQPTAEIASLVEVSQFCEPPVPTGQAASAVATRLQSNPADTTELIEYAAQYHVSTRTLQRQFLQSTGLPFSEWRAATRVAAAARLLAQGHTSAQAAKIVGFGATSSLIRAFKRHTGTTPGAFMKGSTRGAVEIAPTTIFARAEQDLMLWVATGTATVTTTGYCRFMGQGEIVTILAGTNTRLDVSAGSVALPVPLDFDGDDPAALHNALQCNDLRVCGDVAEDARRTLVPAFSLEAESLSTLA